MKRAKRDRKAMLEPTAKARDLTVTPAVDTGVMGGEEEKKATPKLLEAAIKGKVFKTVEIHGTA